MTRRARAVSSAPGGERRRGQEGDSATFAQATTSTSEATASNRSSGPHRSAVAVIDLRPTAGRFKGEGFPQELRGRNSRRRNRCQPDLRLPPTSHRRCRFDRLLRLQSQHDPQKFRPCRPSGSSGLDHRLALHRQKQIEWPSELDCPENPGGVTPTMVTFVRSTISDRPAMFGSAVEAPLPKPIADHRHRPIPRRHRRYHRPALGRAADEGADTKCGERRSPLTHMLETG